MILNKTIDSYGIMDRINQNLDRGILPSSELVPVKKENDTLIDIKKESEFGLHFFMENPSLFSNVVCNARKIIDVQIQIGISNFDGHDFNSIININRQNNIINIYNIKDFKSDYSPVVTFLDKVLWEIISMYNKQISEAKNDDLDYLTNSVFYTFIYLFIRTQEIEKEKKITIKEEFINESLPLLEIIIYDLFGKNGDYCRKLTDKENEELDKLFNRRNETKAFIEKSIRISNEIAECTQQEWDIFIKILNDLSKKEAKVIDTITNDSLPTEEKKSEIVIYDSAIDEIIEDGIYRLENEKINLYSLLEKLTDRMNHAKNHCFVKCNDSDEFLLSSSALYLVQKPLTYNYLFITFHFFRLFPSKYTATRFFEIALACISRNFGIYTTHSKTLNEMIKSFHDIIVDYTKKYGDKLDTITEFGIQEDSVIADRHSYEGIKKVESMIETVNSYNSDCESEDSVENLKNVINKIMEEIGNNNEEIEKNIDAHILVLSLNIIYLYCEALRIIIETNNIECNLEKAIMFRREISRIDRQLVFKVYGDLSNNEMDMFEYRENKGIDSRNIVFQEKKSDELQNQVLLENLMDKFSILCKNIQEQRTDQLIDTKEKIKESIAEFPLGENKYKLIEKIEEISEQISRKLVDETKSDPDYLDSRKEITDFLGEKSSILPISVLDTLTTGELLFKKYANEQCAKNGFDYSCISALYFQAFENAYNALIWLPYSNMLNSLFINNEQYSCIIENIRKGKFEKESKGYLFDEWKNRRHYVEYKNDNNEKTHIKNSCMYVNFTKLMDKIHPDSELYHFCDYFANLAGFNDRSEMFDDSVYMSILMDFIESIKNSAGDRNNASHGGNHITVEQCKKDKRTVLSDLENVRNNHLGLIQKLINILSIKE